MQVTCPCDEFTFGNKVAVGEFGGWPNRPGPRFVLWCAPKLCPLQENFTNRLVLAWKLNSGP